MNYKISRLKNGTRVVAAPLKERKSVSIGLWVEAGGRDEEARVSGISHFLEHMVFKGTSKRTANQIKEAVEGVGGSMNAFTGEEYTCFLAKASRRHFEEVFAVLADMVLDASLKSEEIEKERTVIMEEIKMTQDQPSQLAEELLSEIVWSGHALGRPLAGTIETVGALKREELLKYRDTYYRPGFVTVAASGDIDQKTLTDITQAHFKENKPTPSKKKDPFTRTDKKSVMKFFSKATEQTHLALAARGFPKNHPDEDALDLLSVVLGGNMSSRLFNEVREERGLAYDIGSYVRKYHETGAFIVAAGVDNKKSKEAMKVIIAELRKIAAKEASAGELERAREFYLGQLDLGLENTMNHMLWVGESVVSFDRCKTQKEIVEKVKKVTAKDLTRVAAQLFGTKALYLAMVGPDVSEADFENILSA